MKMMRGGEIFVPKIPSMSMTDLASVMGAGMPQRIVGIRPGEKLHEALISRDDARLTRELTDRYIVLPAIRGWSVGDPTFPGDRPVDEEFAYASDTNQEWLDADGLGRLLTLAQA
jgi:UDP-N-acetylglucosamine 4,6-dehydratase